MLLSQFFEEVYLPLRLLNCRPRTPQIHRSTITVFDRFNGRPVELSELSDLLFAKFAQWMLKEGRSARTVNCYFRHLRAIWRFAHHSGKVPTAPKISDVAADKKFPVAWTPAEIGRLISEGEKQEGEIGGIPAGLFWRAFILFLYDTGLRKGLVLNLPLRNLDLERRYVIAPAVNQKHRRDQLAPFSKETADVLRQMMDPRRELLFPWPFDRYELSTWTSFGRRLRKMVIAAGLDPDDGICQRIRRTCATIADEAEPGVASVILDHSSPKLAKDHYIDPRFCQRVLRVVDRFPRPPQPPAWPN